MCRKEKSLVDHFQYNIISNCFSKDCKECRNNKKRHYYYSRIIKEDKKEGETKICTLCNKELEIISNFNKRHKTNDYFPQCRKCYNVFRNMKVGKNKIPKYTIEHAAKYIVRSTIHHDKIKGRDNDITLEFAKASLLRKCVYCGLPSQNLDRVDNSIGHLESNCVPCCRLCNFTRADRFSYEEMLIIGKTVRQVIDNRK